MLITAPIGRVVLRIKLAKSKPWELVIDREDRRAAVHWVAKSRTGLKDWTELKYYSMLGAKTSRWEIDTTSSAPAWSLRSRPSSKLPPASPACVVMVCSALDRGFFRSLMSLSLPLRPEQITLQWKQYRYWHSARPQFSNPGCTLESPGGAFNMLPGAPQPCELYWDLKGWAPDVSTL